MTLAWTWCCLNEPVAFWLPLIVPFLWSSKSYSRAEAQLQLTKGLTHTDCDESFRRTCLDKTKMHGLSLMAWSFVKGRHQINLHTDALLTDKNKWKTAVVLRQILWWGDREECPSSTSKSWTELVQQMSSPPCRSQFVWEFQITSDVRILTELTNSWDSGKKGPKMSDLIWSVWQHCKLPDQGCVSKKTIQKEVGTEGTDAGLNNKQTSGFKQQVRGIANNAAQRSENRMKSQTVVHKSCGNSSGTPDGEVAKAKCADQQSLSNNKQVLNDICVDTAGEQRDRQITGSKTNELPHKARSSHNGNGVEAESTSDCLKDEPIVRSKSVGHQNLTSWTSDGITGPKRKRLKATMSVGPPNTSNKLQKFNREQNGLPTVSLHLIWQTLKVLRLTRCEVHACREKSVLEGTCMQTSIKCWKKNKKKQKKKKKRKKEGKKERKNHVLEFLYWFTERIQFVVSLVFWNTLTNLMLVCKGHVDRTGGGNLFGVAFSVVVNEQIAFVPMYREQCFALCRSTCTSKLPFEHMQVRTKINQDNAFKVTFWSLKREITSLSWQN